MFRRLIHRSLPSCSQQVRSKVTFSVAHAQDGAKEYLQFLADKKKSVSQNLHLARSLSPYLS